MPERGETERERGKLSTQVSDEPMVLFCTEETRHAEKADSLWQGAQNKGNKGNSLALHERNPRRALTRIEKVDC